MKPLVTKIIAAVAFPSAAFAINTYNVFTDASGAIQVYESGGAVKITSAYWFEVGVFPTTTNFTDAFSIASNFISFGAAANWDADLIDIGVGGASLSFSFDELSGYPSGIPAGSALSIWIYNSKTPVLNPGWGIISNPNWVVQPLTPGAAVDSRDYTITDAGTVIRLGHLIDNKLVIPVPESSSFAALAGFAVLGVATCGRRRA